MRFAFAVLCVTSLCAIPNAKCQTSEVPALRFAAGAVVTFHVQSRLQPDTDDALEGIAQGTAIQVKLLDAIDSTQNHDGSAFRGTLVSSIGSGKAAIHADAEVRGILVLLRSKSHPNGFRYELMVTSINENGQSHPLTASLSSSLFEAASSPVPASGPAASAPQPSRSVD